MANLLRTSDAMLPRDYRLHELHDTEFEELIVSICVRWLGEGVTPFAPGKDGGRDGKFHGTANCFPDEILPLDGHFVLQAKHVNFSDRSCSDRDFASLLRKEHPKIKRLAKAGICDHYIVFTNRRYTGGADEKYMVQLKGLGIKTAHIVGSERLRLALNDYKDIRDKLPNRYDTVPFRFEPDDMVEVIGALNEFTQDDTVRVFDSAKDFEKIKIQQKNKINGVTPEYFEKVISADSMPHFERVAQFLNNPRNAIFAELYHDAANELKHKIFLKRDEFESFDEIFVFLYDAVQQRREALRGKRRLITILLHYMYCNCDFGMKEAADTGASSC